MNREDHDFDQLRRLLKLKRYEQPPPRYFNDFSMHVVVRLQSAQQSSSSANWLQRLWGTFELRPVVPAALGVAICGLLVVGAVYTEQAEVPQFLPSGATAFERSAGRDSPEQAQIWPAAPDQTLAVFSTNPVPAATGTLFDQIRPGGTIMRAGHPMFK